MDPIHSVSNGSAGGTHVSAGSAEKDTNRLRETARDLEGVFLGMLMKAMRSTISSGGLFKENSDNQTYREMFDQEIAKSMARAGGIGLAQLIVRDQLLRQSAGEKLPGSECAEAAAVRKEPEGPGGGSSELVQVRPLKNGLKFLTGTTDIPNNGLTSTVNGGTGESTE